MSARGQRSALFHRSKNVRESSEFLFFSLSLCTNMLCYCHYSTPHNYNQSTLYSIDGSVCRWNTIFVNTFSPQTQFQWPSTWFFFARLLAIIFRLAQICASYSVIHFRFEMWFVLLHHHFMHLLAVGYSLSLSRSPVVVIVIPFWYAMIQNLSIVLTCAQNCLHLLLLFFSLSTLSILVLCSRCRMTVLFTLYSFSFGPQKLKWTT